MSKKWNLIYINYQRMYKTKNIEVIGTYVFWSTTLTKLTLSTIFYKDKLVFVVRFSLKKYLWLTRCISCCILTKHDSFYWRRTISLLTSLESIIAVYEAATCLLPTSLFRVSLFCQPQFLTSLAPHEFNSKNVKLN